MTENMEALGLMPQSKLWVTKRSAIATVRVEEMMSTSRAAAGYNDKAETPLFSRLDITTSKPSSPRPPCVRKTSSPVPRDSGKEALPPPLLYGIKGGAFMSWLIDFDDYCDYHGIADVQKCLCAIRCLKKFAIYWLVKFQTERIKQGQRNVNSWTELKVYLMNEFGGYEKHESLREFDVSPVCDESKICGVSEIGAATVLRETQGLEPEDSDEVASCIDKNAQPCNIPIVNEVVVHQAPLSEDKSCTLQQPVLTAQRAEQEDDIVVLKDFEAALLNSNRQNSARRNRGSETNQIAPIAVAPDVLWHLIAAVNEVVNDGTGELLIEQECTEVRGSVGSDLVRKERSKSDLRLHLYTKKNATAELLCLHLIEASLVAPSSDSDVLVWPRVCAVRNEISEPESVRKQRVNSDLNSDDSDSEIAAPILVVCNRFALGWQQEFRADIVAKMRGFEVLLFLQKFTENTLVFAARIEHNNELKSVLKPDALEHISAALVQICCLEIVENNVRFTGSNGVAICQGIEAKLYNQYKLKFELINDNTKLPISDFWTAQNANWFNPFSEISEIIISKLSRELPWHGVELLKPVTELLSSGYESKIELLGLRSESPGIVLELLNLGFESQLKHEQDMQHEIATMGLNVGSYFLEFEHDVKQARGPNDTPFPCSFHQRSLRTSSFQAGEDGVGRLGSLIPPWPPP